MPQHEDKTQADLAAEQAQRAETARKADVEQRQHEADRKVAEAQREADAIVDDTPHATKGKGAGTDPDYTGGVSLHDHQIQSGQAPIAPGLEKPVSEEDARLANENRGR